MGIGVLSPEVMRPGRDVDHSPPSSAKGNKEWRYTSTPPVCFHGMSRDNFTIFVVKYVCIYSKTCLKRNAIVPVFFFSFSQVSVLQRIVF